MATHTRQHRPGAGPALGAAAVFALAVLAAALVGGLAAGGAGEVYARLDLPAWAPPQWLFGPAWTVLYLLIAVSGWLLWRAAGWRRARAAFAVFAVQLVLNAAWTPLFFGAGLFGWALADILLLVAAIAVLIGLARRHSGAAALLLVPYLLWTAYAGALNAAIVAAN
jgi:tryptophan-rich sensory protein